MTIGESKPVTKEESALIAQAQDKWWNVIFQSYNTNVLDLMAHPVKKAIIATLLSIVAFVLYAKFTKLDKRAIKNMSMWIVLGVVVVFGMTYYTQWKTNENVIAVATRLPNRFKSTVFDYQNNMVVQGSLLRSRSGTSLGDALLITSAASSVSSSSKSKRR